LSFFIFVVALAKTTKPIITHDGSYDAVSHKKVPFGLWIIADKYSQKLKMADATKYIS